MSENFEEKPESDQIRVNALPNKKRIVRSSMFGIPEFIAIGLGLLSLLSVGLFYFFYVSPANAELKLHKDISQKLSTENDDAKKKFGNISTTKERVSELLNSVDYFERNYLPIASLGKTGLYQRINALISAYGLVNTTGPDFTPLEISTIKQSQQNEKEKGRGKFQSLFPGVYVSVTVEGTYQNLRRFIREIESSGQFVIVSTVELEAAEGENKIANQPAQPARKVPAQRTPYPRPNNPTEGEFPVDPANPNLAPQTTTNPKFVPLKGKTRGDVVSLHLEMAAYFRRNIQSEQQILAAEKVANE